MNLFTVGPVNMTEEIRAIGGEPIPYFRTPEFSAMMIEIETILCSLLDSTPNTRVLTLTASGTGAMEAAVANVLTKEDKVLIIEGGSFGHRFIQLCQCFQIPYEVLSLAFDEELSEERLVPYEGKGYTALLVNLHETSIGKLYDYQLLGGFCKRNQMYYIVDAISTFLADELSMKLGFIDVVILSSQKGLALPPGLSFLAMSKRIIKERVQQNQMVSIYFDLKQYLKDMERGQTPFTPAVGIIYQLYRQVKHLEQVGVERAIAYHQQLAEHFRGCCQEQGIEIPDFPMSNALTTVLFPDGNAVKVVKELKHNHKMMVTPNGGIYEDKIVRVGHLGVHRKEEYEELAKLLKEYRIVNGKRR